MRTPVPASRLKILMFGPPGSGKSSLLGALMQACQAGSSQSLVLHGTLVDDTGRLSELREHTYADAPPSNRTEIVDYPVHFTPEAGTAGGAAAVGAAVAANLLDSDGT